MRGTSDERPRVTIVLPVYNTRAYLRECLDSLVGQQVESGSMEVIAIDDGSTDGSGEILDEYAAQFSYVRVEHQENSGWPGQPRNRGIELATGRYVYFVDSDDWLGPETIERIGAFADEHGSDIVVPRLVYTGAPPGKTKTWKTAVDASLLRVFKTLSPQKLFRREFLEAHRLRFPEGEVRLEDGIFVTHAYLLAGRVSLLGDYDYYFKRKRDDGENISFRRVDPAGYVASLRAIAENVRALCADPRLQRDLVLLIYNRKGLTRLVKGARYARRKRDDFSAWVECLAEFAEEFVSTDDERRLPAKRRALARAVRNQDVDRAAAEARSLGSRRRRRVARARMGGFVSAARGRARSKRRERGRRGPRETRRRVP